MVKYLLFAGHGKRTVERDRVRKIIRNLRLGMEVESLKFEGGRSAQFYFGIGVNLDGVQDGVPKFVTTLLNEIGARHMPNRASMFFEAEELPRSFLSDNFEYDSFLEPIRFEPMPETGDEEFHGEDLPDIETSHHASDEVAMDRLLWWMSAKGEGSWQSFRQVVSQLFQEHSVIEKSPWTMMRKLILLGYVETGNDGEWGMVPTTLVRTEGAGTFLAGKVTPALMCRLGGHTAASSNGGPMRIGIEGSFCQDGIPVIDEPATVMASAVPDFDTWLGSLRSEPDIEPHRYTLRLYDGQYFREYEGSAQPGFYEVERIEGEASKKRVLYDGKCWIGGGYYDLRWSAKRIGGAAMEVWIEPDGTLLVPEAERWPMLYERPLVLSSGRLPATRVIGSHDVLVYELVGKVVAGLLTEKLGIKLMEV